MNLIKINYKLLGLKKMMKKQPVNTIRKTFISTAIATILTAGSLSSAQADVYEFTFENGGCSTGTCTGPGDALFTIVSPSGDPIMNTSYPYYGDYTWHYGFRTQLGGNLTIDTGAGTGSMTINPFDFFASGPAVPHDITLTDLDDASDPTGTLWLANMLFDWNGNSSISISVVIDMQGLLTSLASIQNGDVIDGTGVLGGTDGMRKGMLPMGPLPIATSTLDTDGVSITGDDGLGGSPMDNGPFQGFSANFDFSKLTFTGYIADTTPPVVTLSHDNIFTSASSFDPYNPGVTVTCTDNRDGIDIITQSPGVNPRLSFTVNSNVNTDVVGSYQVEYRCTDSAYDEPLNDYYAGNTSAPAILTVFVTDPDGPVLTINSYNPFVHQACTAYFDAGATASDPQDDDNVLTQNIVVSGNTIEGLTLNENGNTYLINYDVTDSGEGNASGAPLAAITETRSINIVDTAKPIVSIFGGASINIESSQADNYVVPMATAVDANNDCNPVFGGVATTTDSVNFVVPAGQDTLQSTLRYFATDSANTPNETQSNQVVTVTRSEPVITLVGGDVSLVIDDVYVEQGFNVHDVQDGDLTAITTSGTSAGVGALGNYLIHNITIRDNSSSIVNSIVASEHNGPYTVYYDVTDSDSNSAVQVTRKVEFRLNEGGGNFTLLTAEGSTFGGTNDVVFNWDESFNTFETDINFNMTISSELPQPLFGFSWVTHHIRVFGPGTYLFDTTCAVWQLEAGLNVCNNPLSESQTEQFLSMTVEEGQVGAHILIDWNGNTNIDMVNVWNRDAVWDDADGVSNIKNNLFGGDAGSAPDPASTWMLVSTDVNGDGINGSPMVDGPFIGFYANFNAAPSLDPFDTDGDGIQNLVDNCPNTFNQDQKDNGGLDSNSPDGIGDACQCGDINGDGKITNTDSVLIKRHLIGLPSKFEVDFCDVSGDGACTNTDAVIIQRSLLGLPPGLRQVCVAAGN
ncbi:MAG: hypothetical protein DIZ80_12900 [endosymbiont of Galathealinum brachiosum]|uniref:Dockerin domain-containing protein n=1 Tax=endosymbiont of Galathealinum brachiosum TaxID=2200906 RepID=A0A370DA10_9GAMM|nr:MAG: hypothetical protein DIZ80_12900 [endosymbiont of Galathealinum brachiosum]